METTGELSRTVLHAWHLQAGAKMVPFAGYEMPIQYSGILGEHLATRRRAGLFDISHMGRFRFSGDAVPFLQHVLTNNAGALHEPGMAQYTLIPDEDGGAIDDAYLYRTGERDYMLVVNSSNRAKDWAHLSQFFDRFRKLESRDASEEIAMFALQGPESERILESLLARTRAGGQLPENERNRLSTVTVDGARVVVARTGYTGEPVGFELFVPSSRAVKLWKMLLEVGGDHGIAPVGLGARDTLRLEAGYPLYGHELGEGPDGSPTPIFALPQARAATRFDEGKGDFIGREALFRQYLEVSELLRGGAPKPIGDRFVPRLVWPLAVLNDDGTGPSNNPTRQGNPIQAEGRQLGWITSGSTVPHWTFEGGGLLSEQAEQQGRRAVGLAYVDSAWLPGEFGVRVTVAKPGAGKPVQALLVESNLRQAPPYARPVIHPERGRSATYVRTERAEQLLEQLARRAVDVTVARQQRQFNLIPSEQTPSLLVRLLSILDPAGRYAEHNRLEALGKSADDIFHYQGTGFIKEVEAEVQAFFRDFLRCTQVEARPISGQMANHTVFRGILDYLNRFRKEEPRRIGYVFVNGLRNGGHLSAQMLGSLRNHVRYDPETGRPAVMNFPTMEENPYRIDVERTKEMIDRYAPELIVLGKSMTLHPEPVRVIADYVRDRGTLVMYDMAHVLGLAGPHFQQPFDDGADLVTGSTHKTFFGTQRGIVASNMSEDTERWQLWEKIVAAAFPGSTSNHHPGTLLGLLGSCYEMMAYGDEYQRHVMANAKAFARALHAEGLTVEGDPSIDFTETHQVLLRVGNGPEVAHKLEANNIVVNSQVLPSDASVTAASGIRLGVQEMTRFGMGEEDFRELAGFLAGIIQGEELADVVAEFRGRFTEMLYCLPPKRAEGLVEELIAAIR
jgi:aminomethyltransferase